MKWGFVGSKLMTVVLSGIKVQGLIESGLGRGKSLTCTTTEASENPTEMTTELFCLEKESEFCL